MISFLIIIVSMATFHFVADYALQSDYIASNKGKSWYVLTAHVMIYGAVVSVAPVIMGKFDQYQWLFAVLVLGLTHYVDVFKAKGKLTLFQDQLIHGLVIVFVASITAFAM